MLNMLNMFRLKHQLIPACEWSARVPMQVFQQLESEKVLENKMPIGIGHDSKIGWYALMGRQYTIVLWQEHA